MKDNLFVTLCFFSPLIVLGIALFLKLIENKLFPKPDKARVMDVHTPKQNARNTNDYLMYKIGVWFLLFIGAVSVILFLTAFYTENLEWFFIGFIVAIFGGGFVCLFFWGTQLIVSPFKLIIRKQAVITKDILSGKRKESYMFTLSDPTQNAGGWNYYRDYIHYPLIFVLFGIIFLLTVWKGTNGLILGAFLFFPCLFLDYICINSAKKQLVREAFPERVKHFKMEIQWRIAFIELANQYHFPVRKITEEEWAQFYYQMKYAGKPAPATLVLPALYKDDKVFVEEFYNIIAYAKTIYEKVQNRPAENEKTIELNPFYKPSKDETSQENGK